MNKEEMETLINGMQEKIGKEASALISDDIGKIISDNSLMNSEISKRDDKITKLTTDKENLIETNGNLLQQISMGIEEDKTKNKKEEKKEDVELFDYKKIFDENGNFLR